MTCSVFKNEIYGKGTENLGTQSKRCSSHCKSSMHCQLASHYRLTNTCVWEWHNCVSGIIVWKGHSCVGGAYLCEKGITVWEGHTCVWEGHNCVGGAYASVYQLWLASSLVSSLPWSSPSSSVPFWPSSLNTLAPAVDPALPSPLPVQCIRHKN